MNERGLQIPGSLLPDCKSGRAGWIHDPASGQEPHYIFGIETDDYNSIIAEIGPVVDAHLIGTFADFIQIKKGERLSDYFFRQTTPFYSNGKTK